MNQPPLDPQDLERIIGRVLREQPLRSAPATLEARVLRQLAQQAARPWWQRGFSSWPRTAQWLLLPLAAACVWASSLSANALLWLSQSLQRSSLAAAAQSGLQAADGMGQAAQTLGSMVSRAIPSIWIYGGAGFALLLYAALFGIGAVAIRALHGHSEHVRY